MKAILKALLEWVLFVTGLVAISHEVSEENKKRLGYIANDLLNAIHTYNDDHEKR